MQWIIAPALAFLSVAAASPASAWGQSGRSADMRELASGDSQPASARPGGAISAKLRGMS